MGNSANGPAANTVGSNIRTIKNPTATGARTSNSNNNTLSLYNQQ